ncbi:hypothetical protein BDV93DRAFT_414334, partial [Ceratobasidium sp. AG-I]
FSNYQAVADEIGSVIESQVRRVAHQEGYRHCVALRKPFIDERTAKQRLDWAKNNRKRNWNSVGWADESIFETGERPSHPRVTRKPHKAHLMECVAPTFRSGRKSVHTWACIAHEYKGPIIRLTTTPRTMGADGRMKGGGHSSQGYADQVLAGPLKEFLDFVGKERGLDMLVVEDGA